MPARELDEAGDAEDDDDEEEASSLDKFGNDAVDGCLESSRNAANALGAVAETGGRNCSAPE